MDESTDQKLFGIADLQFDTGGYVYDNMRYCLSRNVVSKQNYNFNASLVLRYLRMSGGLTQDEMARIIGCSKYRLSRLEAAKLSLLSFEATNIARHFKISLEDFAWGSIFSPHLNGDDFYSFGISPRYRENAHSGGRTLFLHIENFKRVFGAEKFLHLCETEKIDPIYFVNMANPLNIAFSSRLLQEMIKAGHLGSPENNLRYAEAHLNSLHHKGFLDLYDGQKGLEKLVSLIGNAEDYEKNHIYEVLWHDRARETLDVRISLADHVDQRLYFDSPWVGGFLIRKLLPSYFSTFIQSPHRLEILSQDEGARRSSVLRYSLCPA
jgi:transcriptional regulator with XRE-family HTH domain